MALRLVIVIANVFGALSRFLKQGSGVMVGGRILLKLAPNAVLELSKNRQVVLISGTNGKSTTTALITQALNTKSSVVSNSTGANLFAGLASALSQDLSAPVAVLEVDEMVLPWAIAQTKPQLIVLLNLGRDQLDRLSEVRVVAQKWRGVLKTLPASCAVLADADDPFVAWASMASVNVIWFTSGVQGHMDASTCPECGEILQWQNQGATYSCTCGFKKPNPEWILHGNTLLGPQNHEIEITSAIPGKAGLSNAARAVVVSQHFGVDAEDALRAILKITSVDGRFGTLIMKQTRFRLMLSKNPASWRETLATSAQGPKDVLLVVNANVQDGKDTSWLWDVDFAPLKDRTVIVSGDRRLDISARLTVGGIEHGIVSDEKSAAVIFGNVEADLIASYTAFHRLAKGVKKS